MKDEKIKRILEKSPGAVIKTAVEWFEIKEEFLRLSGWKEYKYDLFTKGEWFIPSYEYEAANIVKGLGQSKSSIKFWEEKARNWKMEITDHLEKNSLNLGKEFFSFKPSIPNFLIPSLPKDASLIFYSHLVTKSSGYFLSFSFNGEEEFIQIPYSTFQNLSFFFHELLVLADRFQEIGDSQGEKMTFAIQEYCQKEGIKI